MLFYWLKLLTHFMPSNVFPFFLSICWYCGAVVFGLIRCQSLSSGLALLTCFSSTSKISIASCPLGLVHSP